MDVLTIDSVMTGMHTMKEQLEALRHVDPATVFIARRINKLGFASADTLRSHFSCYGLVKDVLVSHSRVKSFKSTGRRRRGVGEHQRLRAAGLGFVVMGSAEDAAKILNEGPEHNVLGAVVQLQPFHHHSLIEDAGSLDKNDLIAASDKMLAHCSTRMKVKRQTVWMPMVGILDLGSGGILQAATPPIILLESVEVIGGHIPIELTLVPKSQPRCSLQYSRLDKVLSPIIGAVATLEEHLSAEVPTTV